MARLKMLVVLVAVISLPLSVIWPSSATAGVPQIASIGSLQEGLSVPGRMDIDAQGNLYVTDARTHLILKFDSSGVLKNTFSAVSASGLALAVNDAGTRIYVAEKGGRVAILNGLTGEFLSYLGDLTATGDVAVDSNGSVYVVDPLDVKVIKYNSAGEMMTSFSGFGGGEGEFQRIAVVAVNESSKEVYVSGDSVPGNMAGSSFVQIFDFNGQYLGKIDTLADFGGALILCSGIVFDADGREYYIDGINASIRVRDRDAGFLTKLSLEGSAPGSMLKPVDLVYDATSSRILVASDNVKIELFSIDGGTTPPVNQPPSQPTLVSPTAGGNATSLTPQLRFSNAVDANNDSVTYDIEIDGEVKPDNAQNGATESYFTSAVLVENSQHVWRVLARDEHGAESAYTAAQTFFINVDNEAPSAPSLSPTAGSLKGTDILSWSIATDPDPNDALSYRVEVAEDITFTEPTLTAELDLTDIQLTAFDNYAMLQDGINYVWRVTAVDKAGLATSSEVGNFVYDTALLTISANMPDAQVYLGGNTAYAGKKVGVAPVEFRDLPAGAYTVVVERAGCEQFIAQVEIVGASNADVAAVLNLAVAPSLRNDSDLRVGKSKLQVGMNAAPFVVDFNNDGLLDLLVGDESGLLSLFVATSQRGSKVQYDEAIELNVARIVGAVPVVVDWNNDNRKDLLIGGVDGGVTLFLQESTSSDLNPAFADGSLLQIDALKALNVGSAASPAVFDLDADGNKDLVVGTADGKLFSFRNIGTDAAPVLADAVEIGTFSGQVAPLFIDWDADGQRDLLMSNAGTLSRLVLNDGAYVATETLLSSRSTLDTAVRFFVVDLDSEQGKDVFAGFNDGKVTYFRSAGRDYLPTVTQALLDKLAQVQDLADVAGLELQLDTVAAAIDSADLKVAGRLAKKLLSAVPTGVELEVAAAELLELLSR